ncbi:hypothetical protein HanHA300_Chr15g0577581 [Helianthus annuus]|nr:hypothetical protein HanHA300_Chr15g0577581 [Helianthus annuus]KAJ0649787.1 hypothetical protein HanLR1_Chr15g0588241 [Helianthus annuus]
MRIARVAKWIVINECKPDFPSKISFLYGWWSYVLVSNIHIYLYLMININISVFINLLTF